MAGARDYNPPPPFFSSPRPFKHQIQESAAVKAYDAEWKWMNSSEAKQRSAAAKAFALSDFQKRFPHAQMSRFQVQVEFDANRKALGRVLFPDFMVLGRTRSSKTKSTGPLRSKPLWGRNKMGAFLLSCRCCPHNHKHLSQSQQSRSQTTEGKESRISLTSR